MMPIQRLIIASLATTPLLAQSWLVDAREHRHLPLPAEAPVAVAAGDVDGDRVVDLVIACPSGQNLLYRGVGDGEFVDATTSSLPLVRTSTMALALVDIDGDRDLDLVFGEDDSPSTGARDRVYINDGAGHFQDETTLRMPNVVERTLALVAGDLDGDGDIDLIAGAAQKFDTFSQRYWDGTSRLYLNDGTGVFSDATAGRLAITPDWDLTSLRLADVTGDGLADLLVTQPSAPGPSLFLAQPGAVFVDATTARLPTLPSLPISSAAGDVDGDGDVDLVFGYSSVGAAPNLLLLNDGTGVFALAPAGWLPADQDLTRTLEFADFDGDGDLDLHVGNSLRPSSAPVVAARDRIYSNDGAGHFVSIPLPAMDSLTAGVAVADLDGDGDLDVCTAERALRLNLYLGDGAGHFALGTRRALPSLVFACADFDGDGDLDAIGEPGFQRGTRLWVNDGRGVFNMAADALPGLTTSSGYKTVGGAATGDLDGDGDIDLVLALRHGYRNLLLENRGAAGFLGRGLGASGDDSTSVVLGDVDGDGDLDVIFGNDYGNTGRQNRLIRNDGQLVFTEVAGALPTAADRTRGVALGDVDLDGDLDLVAANLFGQSTLALNDGNGTFTDGTSSRLPSASLPSYGIALGDVDGDGDLDLILANDGRDSALYVNDGRGIFTASPPGAMPARTDGVHAAAFGDLDEDGDLDLVMAPYRNAALLLENDGLGHFTDVSARGSPVVVTSDHLVLADLDGDRDLDVAIGGEVQSQVFFNRLRNLEAPFVPDLGGTLRLEIHGSGGTPGPQHLAEPLIGFARTFLPMPPYGVLRIDPAAMVVMPLLSFDASSGPAVLSVPVPNVPALLGAEVVAQAIVGDVSRFPDFHLTGLVAVRLHR